MSTKKNIDDAVKALRTEMLEYWRRWCSSAGFAYKHQQDLYDVLCVYMQKEKDLESK